MTDTHFENPTGLTSQNVSSARDLVKMVNAAYQYPLIRKFSTDRSYEGVTRASARSPTTARTRSMRNPTWDIGLQKTGFINEAGECLVMQANIHGRPMVLVLLDSSGKYSRFADADAAAHVSRQRRRSGAYHERGRAAAAEPEFDALFRATRYNGTVAGFISPA